MSAIASPALRPRRLRRSALPGLGLSMGITLTYLSLLVLIPLSTIVLKTSTLTWARFWQVVGSPRALASYRVSLTTSLAAAAINVGFGLTTAWVLVRYRFPGRKLLDALIDLPFALPTAVSGIALTALYGPRGWLGRPLRALGIEIAYTQLGITLVLTFVTLPFVVRTVQPILEELDGSMEEAAATLGASRWITFRRVILPNLTPALLTGFALSFARALGEYGSVVFISGNRPSTTSSPLLIMAKLEQFQYAEATAIALAMLVVSFTLLLAINRLQAWSRRRLSHG
ncbi:MAG: sulfate ABC transporter permease subunit CysT [Deltaproteobacteria bacterium]|nr:sulfate ABC transporter permease subunit CysT [Deltaproteobacteria bacterium]